MKAVTVIGAGFAALTAVKHLRRRLPDAALTLVAPSAQFVYYPSLIWLPSGLRRGEDLRLDLSAWLDAQGVNFQCGAVQGLREGGRVVVTDRGELANDGLLIASGGRFTKALPGIEHAHTLCEGIPFQAVLRSTETHLITVS